MIYLLKVNVLLAVFYGFYRLLFVRDTFFTWRRAALLMLMLAAVVLPMADIGWWVESHHATANLSEVYREVMLPTVTVVGSGDRFPWVRLLSLIYIIGMAALLARMLWQVGGIVRLSKTAPRGMATDREAGDEVSVRYLSDATCPFSFFGWIFVNPSAQSEEQLREIMTHERAHAEQWHSVDVVLAELLTAVCWPNPFAWLMRREVRLNLEYLADERVVEAGSERKSYQYHLLGLAYGKNVATISNNFNVLPLKLRIKMMNKQRTNSWLRAKYLLLVPVAAVALVACNLDKKNEKPLGVVVNTGGEQNAVAAENLPGVDTVKVAPEDAYFDVVEQMPEFPGGQTELMKYLQQSVKYPKEAQEKGLQGRVIVSFIVDTDGSVEKPEVVRSVDPQLDAEALRVVKMMPKWQPGKQNGKVVRVKYHFPVTFRLQ